MLSLVSITKSQRSHSVPALRPGQAVITQGHGGGTEERESSTRIHNITASPKLGKDVPSR